MLHLRYWKYSYQFTLCSSDQHKLNKNRKVALESLLKSEKDHVFLTLRTPTLIQKQTLQVEVTAPFALLPPVSPHNPNPFLPEAKTRFYTGCVKTDNSPESDGPILFLLMFPLLFGSSPPLNWIKCNMNCTLRYDDLQISIGINLGYFRQFRSQSLLTLLILTEMD